MKLAITGANGHLAKSLIARLLKDELRADLQLVLLARSKSACEVLVSDYSSDRCEVKQVDYLDQVALTEALAGVNQVIHLVGIIKESLQNSFANAHSETCEVLGGACETQGIDQLIYLSILGADEASANGCLSSKADAENCLMARPFRTHSLRLPMILGLGDYASFALKKNAQAFMAMTFRAESLEQPIDIDDAVSLILKLLDYSGASEVIEFAGPESIPRAELIARAASILNTNARIVSLPIGLGYWLADRLSILDAPPFTPCMLGVLDHDDTVNTAAISQRFDLTLSELDTTLRKVLLT